MGRFSPEFSPDQLYVPDAWTQGLSGLGEGYDTGVKQYQDASVINNDRARVQIEAAKAGFKPKKASDPTDDSRTTSTGGNTPDIHLDHVESIYGPTVTGPNPDDAMAPGYPGGPPIVSPNVTRAQRGQVPMAAPNVGMAGALDVAAQGRRPFSGGAAGGGAAPDNAPPQIDRAAQAPPHPINAHETLAAPPRLPEQDWDVPGGRGQQWTYDPNFEGDRANRTAEDLTIRGINRRRPAVDEMAGAGMLPHGSEGFVAQEPESMAHFPYFNTYKQAFPERLDLQQDKQAADMARLMALIKSRKDLESLRLKFGANSPQFLQARLRLVGLAIQEKALNDQATQSAKMVPSGVNALMAQSDPAAMQAAAAGESQRGVAMEGLAGITGGLVDDILNNYAPDEPGSGYGGAATSGPVRSAPKGGKGAPAGSAGAGKGAGAPAVPKGLPGADGRTSARAPSGKQYFLYSGKIPVSAAQYLKLKNGDPQARPPIKGIGAQVSQYYAVVNDPTKYEIHAAP